MGKISRYTWGKKNKHFEQSEYYKLLFTEYYKNIKLVNQEFKRLIDRYSDESIIDYDVEEFKIRCESFYKIVCENLSKKDYDPDLSETIKIFDL